MNILRVYSVNYGKTKERLTGKRYRASKKYLDPWRNWPQSGSKKGKVYRGECLD